MAPALYPRRVWDLPTRIFHVLLIVCVAGLYFSAEFMEDQLQLHFYFGYGVLSLLVFRLVWGFIGGHWSRFVNFVPSPSLLRDFVRTLAHEPRHFVGHNPLGALSVLAMLTLLLVQVLTGFFSYDEVAFSGPWYHLVSDECSAWLTYYHSEVGKALLLMLLALHIGTVVFYKRVKHQDLISPMIHGDKSLSAETPASQDTWGTRLMALGVLLFSMGLTYGLVCLGG